MQRFGSRRLNNSMHALHKHVQNLARLVQTPPDCPLSLAQPPGNPPAAAARSGVRSVSSLVGRTAASRSSPQSSATTNDSISSTSISSYACRRQAPCEGKEKGQRKAAGLLSCYRMARLSARKGSTVDHVLAPQDGSARTNAHHPTTKACTPPPPPACTPPHSSAGPAACACMGAGQGARGNTAVSVPNTVTMRWVT